MKAFLIFTTIVLHLVLLTNANTACDECLDCSPFAGLADELFPGGTDASNYCGEDANQHSKCYCVQPLDKSYNDCKLMSTEERKSINKCYPNWKCSDLINAPLCSANSKCGHGFECIRTCCVENPLRCLQCCDTSIPPPVISPTIAPSVNCSCNTCLNCSISDPNGHFFPDSPENRCDANDNHKCYCVPSPEVPITRCDIATDEQIANFKCYPNLLCEDATSCNPNTANSCPTDYDCIQTCCNEEFEHKCVKCCGEDETEKDSSIPTNSPTVAPTIAPTLNCSCNKCNKDCIGHNRMFRGAGARCGISKSGLPCACVRPPGISYTECLNTDEDLRMNTCYNNARCDDEEFNIPCDPNKENPCEEGYDCVKTCCDDEHSPYRCVSCCEYPS